MADITFVVATPGKTMDDMAGAAEVQAGNAPGADDFLLPNDGNTFLCIHAVTGDTWTVTAVPDKYGRTETLTLVIAAGDIGIYGPFNPDIWNNSDGHMVITPTAYNVGDLLYAYRCSPQV